MAAGDTFTFPFCGSCGWDMNENLNADVFCDACGADLRRFLEPGQFAPTAFTGIPSESGVDFTWIPNPGASSTESRFSIDGAEYSAWITDTSPTTVPASPGEEVCLQLRSVINGQEGVPITRCAVVLFPLATGADAGEPGAFTPPENRIPDAGEITGVLANPQTLWTVGQYVEIDDGSSYHWNSIAWVAGIAP